MINFDDFTGKNIKQHNLEWPQISDHPCRVLIVDGFGSVKINALLNLTNTKQKLIKYVFMLKIHMNRNINIS